MKITKQWLITAHACHSQVEIFDEEWPDGAEITLENYLRAAELNLDLGWFAKNIFSAPAQKAYDEAMAIAQKAYDIAMAQAQKVYDIAIAPPLEAYDIAMAQAQKVYDIATGTAFVAIYKKYGTENPGLRED